MTLIFQKLIVCCKTWVPLTSGLMTRYLGWLENKCIEALHRSYDMFWHFLWHFLDLHFGNKRKINSYQSQNNLFICKGMPSIFFREKMATRFFKTDLFKALLVIFRTYFENRTCNAKWVKFWIVESSLFDEILENVSII